MSKTTVNVSFLKTLSKKSCVKESINPYPADPPTVQMNPIAYLPLEASLDSVDSSLLKARRIEEMVRRTKELMI